ncbi:PorP/SprF family type IX secretion system membrane protein [Tamlana agarivorans]|uniref:PorP/SprF family type IX secretion system membrane protein n=1 Tax=Pseudotamlana agarivorans TaxID=481183 RepID=A0ACC5U4Z0_9FLAO|nr:PorP/SprF family type IX secretion system membrane protein [Tamlana agarivorans]MBU2949336.1 PorP/SprF family type IX secretion system membrane protein [Tamlana agarivorans]
MNNKHIILIVIILSTSFSQSIFGQQTPVFSNYSANGVIINPAYAGFYPDMDITFTSSGQLNKAEGSPKTMSLLVNAPTSSDHVGVGGGAYSDQIGVTTATNLFGTYSYKLFFDADSSNWWTYNPHVLSFGISAGVMFFDENLLELGINNDPNFANNISTTIPTIGLGALYNRERAFIGLSASNVLGDALSSEDNINVKGAYYLYGGYRFFTNRFQEVMVTPSALFKYVSGAPMQVDLNTKINYKNIFEVGAGYRTDASLNLFVGLYLFEHLRMMYSYNKTLKNTNLTDSHGIVLSFRLRDGFSRPD